MNDKIEEKSLSLALSDSINKETIECISNFTEIGLDAIMENGVLKDIPFISTAVSIYKIGNSIKERHNIKKLIEFLNAINNGILDENKRLEYQEKFKNNEKFRNQEIEYLLILIDRYISYDKPRILAKLYLAYLDGNINRNEFQKYSAIIDSLLPEDIYALNTLDFTNMTQDDKDIDSALRLSSVGLISQNTGINNMYDEKNESLSLNNETGYTFTKFGEKLRNIMEN